MTRTIHLPSHAIEYASRRVGQLHLMRWSCACGGHGEWRAAEVSKGEADAHLALKSVEMLAVDLIADAPDPVHRDAMTDEQFRRYNTLKRELVHAALSRAAARRETVRVLTLVAETQERLEFRVAEGDARMISETEREKMERELTATRAQHEENECGRRLDIAADALLTEIERGR
jgi:hypothetical protein